MLVYVIITVIRWFLDKLSVFVKPPIFFVARVAINESTTPIFVATPLAHIVLRCHHEFWFDTLFTLVAFTSTLRRAIGTHSLAASIAHIHARIGIIVVVSIALIVILTRCDTT